MPGRRRPRIVVIAPIPLLLIAVALAMASLTACTTSGIRPTPTATPATAVEPSAVKGWHLSDAGLQLEGNGWTVKARATKGRSIKPGDEDNWQVIKVATHGRTVTLTVGKLTTKTERIAFRTRTVKTGTEPTSYRVVVQQGERGRRMITYLDGRKIASEVTRKPVTKIIEIGTRRPYTGRCTIWGSYQHRYVKCTGYYNPEARRAARNLANLCNSTSRPLAECRRVYGRYFY